MREVSVYQGYQRAIRGLSGISEGYQRAIRGLSEGYQRAIRGLSEGYQKDIRAIYTCMRFGGLMKLLRTGLSSLLRLFEF